MIEITGCGLVGNIPPSLGECKSLIWLDFSNNKLGGDLPIEKLKGLEELEYVNISQNAGRPWKKLRNEHEQYKKGGRGFKGTGVQLLDWLMCCPKLCVFLAWDNYFYDPIPIELFYSCLLLVCVGLGKNDFDGIQKFESDKSTDPAQHGIEWFLNNNCLTSDSIYENFVDDVNDLMDANEIVIRVGNQHNDEELGLASSQKNVKIV
ncbi:hypothetical protein TrVE_jg14006 [Triparma verrucosa]|uniref:Uncharacterized protein n=1 Tax=Triparma verrucosa TaxID=1606542 RepID=A0A9W7KUI8_9STRA|nr:hypothetical protein TrVE_jg14006 [Triparma verrucosa]